jgi:methanethiol S-methyltransferase
MKLLGGAAFAASLAWCAWTYAVRWNLPHASRFSPSALAWDLLLFTLFALHHSAAAREPVKRLIAAVTGSGAIRTAYVWTASILLAIVCAAWRPVGPLVYRHADAAGLVHVAIQLAGAWLIVDAVAKIDPLELAGLRDPRAAELQTGGPYAWVRHPLYAGWILLAFGARTMTADRLAFASITSTYLLVAIPWEETALRRAFGQAYERYARAVRWRVIPFVY